MTIDWNLIGRQPNLLTAWFGCRMIMGLKYFTVCLRYEFFRAEKFRLVAVPRYDTTRYRNILILCISGRTYGQTITNIFSVNIDLNFVFNVWTEISL